MADEGGERFSGPKSRTRRTWAELDMDALAGNAAMLRSRLPGGCELMPAVKGNAYGHGAASIAGKLQELGVRAFCTASLSEAAALRESGIRGTILILGYTHPSGAELLRRHRLTQTLVDADYARELDEAGGRICECASESGVERPAGRGLQKAGEGASTGAGILSHLAVDTGMHRLGEAYERIDRILPVFRLRSLRVTGMYTHLCAADEPGEEAAEFTMEQIARFRGVLEALRGAGIDLPVHFLNSAGALRFPGLGGAYARVGLALYGVCANWEEQERYGGLLRPVLSLRTRVAAVRQLPAGEGIGYGRCDAAGEPRTIAVLAAGYGDGIPRSLSCGAGEVLIRGRRARIAGRVCMDQMMADVTGIPGVRAGDAATLIGRDGAEEITALELAERAGTIPNEILAGIGERAERIYSSLSP